jgi:UDP-N-acetylmuramate dehydrogenase
MLLLPTQERPSAALQPMPATVRSAVELAPYTSFRVGGKAEWYAEPRTTEELAHCVAWAQAASLPVTMLGSGSNLLISDQGLPGLVISTRFLKFFSTDDEEGLIEVAAGTPLPALSRRLARRGWRGFEWAVGIPGTIGGAVVMNAGAHGGCLADCFVSAEVLGPNGIELWKPEQFDYGYRHSAIQGSNYIVLNATLQLAPGFDPMLVQQETNEALRSRKATQPYDRPSCGSVFRNPLPDSAGRLIEELGLKGYRIGGAKVAERHANFILNAGDAKAQDIFHLIHFIQNTVQEHFSLALHPEVKMLGEFQPA